MLQVGGPASNTTTCGFHLLEPYCAVWWCLSSTGQRPSSQMSLLWVSISTSAIRSQVSDHTLGMWPTSSRHAFRFSLTCSIITLSCQTPSDLCPTLNYKSVIASDFRISLANSFQNCSCSIFGSFGVIWSPWWWDMTVGQPVRNMHGLVFLLQTQYICMHS